MTANIKTLTAKDKTSWEKLWQEYLTFHNTSISSKVTENTWQNIIKSEQVKGFGAFFDNELVAFVHIVIHPNTWNDNDCVYLEDLFVTENARGTGLGRALIEHIYDFASHNNCNRVYWITDEDNYQARQLYDKLARKMALVQYRYDVE